MYAIFSCEKLICGVRSKSGSIAFHTARGLIATAAARRVARSNVSPGRAGDIGPDIGRATGCGEKWRRADGTTAILSPSFRGGEILGKSRISGVPFRFRDSLATPNAGSSDTKGRGTARRAAQDETRGRA
jgi:hypothetical protein